MVSSERSEDFRLTEGAYGLIPHCTRSELPKCEINRFLTHFRCIWDIMEI